MQLGARATVEVAIGGGKTVEELVKLLNPSGQSGGEVINATPRMEAKLVGPGFKVSEVSAKVQEVSRKEPTFWKWDIEAIDSGQQRIHLVVDALNILKGKETARSTSFEETIVVNVDSWEARWAWVKQNWVIVAFLLTAVLGAVGWAIRTLLARKRTPNQTD
jgi:hypothetical protein